MVCFCMCFLLTAYCVAFAVRFSLLAISPDTAGITPGIYITRILYDIENLDTIASIYSFIMDMLSAEKDGVADE